MELWKIASFFLGTVFCTDLVLLCILLRQASKQEYESNTRHWRFVQALNRAKNCQRRAREAAVGEARRVNRAAKVRKWVRRMGLKQNPVYMRERFEKMLEELAELEAAIVKSDRVAIADAVADLQFVLETIPILLGYDGEAAFIAVHESNMTKDPDIFRVDGKGKGESFREPELEKVRGLIR